MNQRLEKMEFQQICIFCMNGKAYDIQKLTFAQVCLKYHTGRLYVIFGSGRHRKLGYRQGCLTEIGDIEISQWRELIQYLIERDGELQLQKNLLSWVKDSCPWLHTQEEQENYALELHAERIFDCKEWVAYGEFNKKYRPTVLQGTMKGELHNECE